MDRQILADKFGEEYADLVLKLAAYHPHCAGIFSFSMAILSSGRVDILDDLASVAMELTGEAMARPRKPTDILDANELTAE